MPENEVAHYCQKCLAANPLGQDFCARCGTRLMIVVEPASMRYESSDAGTGEEHLLERISVLENRLSRLTDRLERALDLVLRQAQNSYFDRALLKSLIGLLTDDGVVRAEKLERVWQQRCDHDAAEQEQSTRREEIRARILAGYRGSERFVFEQNVTEGFLLIEEKNFDGGIKALQRAAEGDPKNGPLLSLVGEHFFGRGKTKPAREYLSRAFELSPEDNRLLLLLGLVCGDEGEKERAREFLQTATRRGGPCFAAHYGLGRLFAAEKKWQEALREFKRALAAKPSPEAHYAMGCLYYQIGRDDMATRHLLKAVELDGEYGEALHFLGLVYQRSGKTELARGAFERAAAGAFKGEKMEPRPSAEVVAASLFTGGSGKIKRWMTGGDQRLAEALREDALRAFLKSSAESR